MNILYCIADFNSRSGVIWSVFRIFQKNLLVHREFFMMSIYCTKKTFNQSTLIKCMHTFKKVKALSNHLKSSTCRHPSFAPQDDLKGQPSILLNGGTIKPYPLDATKVLLFLKLF